MENNKKEIIWNIVNSLLAGALVLLGAFTTGHITLESFWIALIAALIVAVTQFKDYWISEKDEYCAKPKAFGFVKI